MANSDDEGPMLGDDPKLIQGKFGQYRRYPSFQPGFVAPANYGHTDRRIADSGPQNSHDNILAQERRAKHVLTAVTTADGVTTTTYQGPERRVRDLYAEDPTLVDNRRKATAAPINLGAERAARSDEANAWTPKDLLAHLLKAILEGKMDPESMIVCWAGPPKLNAEGRMAIYPTYAQATKSMYQSIGLLEVVKHKILSGS